MIQKIIIMDVFSSNGVGEYAYNIGPLHIKVLYNLRLKNQVS